MSWRKPAVRQTAFARKARRLHRTRPRKALRLFIVEGDFAGWFGEAGAGPGLVRLSCRCVGSLSTWPPLHGDNSRAELTARATSCRRWAPDRGTHTAPRLLAVRQDHHHDRRRCGRRAHRLPADHVFLIARPPQSISGGPSLTWLVPPLYRLTQGAKSVYARDDALQGSVAEVGLHPGAVKSRSAASRASAKCRRGVSARNHDGPRQTHAASRRSGRGGTSEFHGRDAVERLMGSKPEARFAFIQEAGLRKGRRASRRLTPS